MSDQPRNQAAVRILICEDEEMIAEEIAETLISLGYEVSGIATTAEEASRAVGDIRPDLILMDTELRGVVDRISASEQILSHKDIPVVYLSSCAQNEMLRRDKETRPYGYLGKPVDMSELKITVEVALCNHAADKRVRESEERLRSILASLHDFVFLINETGIFNACYQAPCLHKMYVPPEEFIGRLYRDVLPNDVSLMLDGAINSVRAGTDSVVQFDYPMDIAGRKEWFSAKVSKIMNTSGEFDGVTVVCRDITERKKTEQALTRAKEEWELTFDAVPDLIMILDTEHKIVRANKAMVDRLGVTSQQAIGLICYKALHGQKAPPAFCPHSKLLEDGQEHSAEVTDRRLDGIFDVSVAPLYDKDGQLMGSVHIMHDLTERKTAEETQRLERKRFETLAENSPYGLVMISKDGIFDYVNPKFKEIFGYDVGDIPNGREWFKKAYPDPTCRREVIASWIDDLSRSGPGEQRPRIYSVRCKDGTEKIVHFRPVQLDGGDQLMTCEDITDRKKAEKALRESEERFRSLVEQAADSVIVHDFEGNLLSVNQATCDLLGYSREELLSKSIQDVDPDVSSRGDKDKFWPKLPATFEATLKRKDGSIVPVEVRLGPIEVSGKTVILGVARDITERKMAETKLAEAFEIATALRSEAERANQAKSEFLASMSHEFRTPLNAIIGFSEMLEDGTFGTLTDKQLRALSHVVQGGRHLLHLVNDLLDLAKVEAGKMGLELSRVVVPHLLKSSMSIFAGEARRNRLRMEFNIEDDLVDTMIEADEVKVRQILFNLLSNAVKFTADGGSICVHARRDGDNILISVSDTGVGLKPEDNERIFTPFEQVKSACSGRQGGTGLGLALTRRLVEIHGGRIWAESEGPGKGSTFTFSIPANNG